MDPKSLAPYLDLANHHANSTPEEIKSLCQKVIQHGFNGAFVNPCYVTLAKEVIGQNGKVGTVVSFPLGQDRLDTKTVAVKRALTDGADELDISLNIGLIKTGQFEQSFAEMKALVSQVKSLGKEKIVKFIIETGHLTAEEIIIASQRVLDSGADFIKTCSGMGPRGATLEDVDVIKSAIGNRIKIKVAGGIETYEQAVAFIEHGVSRIGTSHAVEILEGATAKG